MMRRFLPLLLAVLLLLAPIAAANADTLRGLNGGKLETDGISGDAIVVVWASWSPKCRDIVERINALEKKWGSDARVISVVFQEDADDVKAFLAKGPKLRAPVFLDGSGTFSKSNHVTSLPGLLIYNDGEQAFRGKLPNAPDSLIGRHLGK